MPEEQTSSRPSKTADRMEGAALPPARLGLGLRAGAREAWDRLGLVIGISLTWALLAFASLSLASLLPRALPPFVRLLLMLLLAALTLSAPGAGAFHVAHLACSHDEVSYLDFWRGARKLFGPATRLGLIHLGVLLLSGVNLWFYLSLHSVVGGLAALGCLYALLLWGMMAVLHGPLLVAQEAGVFDEPERRARRGAWAVLRRAFYLALGDPLYTLGLLAVTLPVTALLFATTLPAVLLWPGLIALLTTPPTRALLVKYGVLPPPPAEEIIPDEKFRIQDVRQD